MRDLGILILRLGLGAFMVGHGGQKLFGWFGGSGLTATGEWLESTGLKPGRPWATLAGISEFGGGALTALGLAYPLGPAGIIGAMTMASVKVHAGRPLWASEGGAELPITNSVIALSLLATGPGRISMDRLLGMKMSPVSAAIILVAAAGALAAGVGSPAQTTAPSTSE